MSEQFLIQGGQKLEGEVEISGAKNSAGPILAATLLTDEKCRVVNLPRVEDVFNLLEIIRSLGAEVEWTGEDEVEIEPGSDLSADDLDLSLIGKSRVSVLLIGSLLSRFKKFRFAPPGGDKIGLRPITTHLDALKKLGLEVKRKNNHYIFDGSSLSSDKVVLREFSVTATEVLMMAAAGLPGETVVKTAAAEPHVRRLGNVLREMGVEIEGVGGHTLRIKGKERLKGGDFEVLSDHVEAGTFFLAGAATEGVIRLKGVVKEDMDFFLAKMSDLGVDFRWEDNDLIVNHSPDLEPVRFQALPWPGFPTDLLPIVVPLLTQIRGKSLIHDPLYENRLNYVQELRKMGADIEIVDPHRALVFGETPLLGIDIRSWDIRAGASLVVAALMAEGETRVSEVNQIDRGYENLDEKLKSLGARIKRVKS